MVKNSAATAYGSKGFKSSKWLLLVCAASAAVVDIFIIALLLAGGEGGGYLACPFLLLIFDLFYIAVSLFFTNFRFKYSIWVWAGYIALYTVGFVIGLAVILGGDGTVLTNGALILWSCVHAFNILCAVVCALFASRVIKSAWFALAVAAVFVAGAAVYAGFMFSDGFFGQGKGNRTLVYSLNASGEYTVTDVLAGRSDNVTVPETFNGKPVTAVSYKVLANGGIKNYSLPENIVFTDKSALNRGSCDGKKITVDKKSVNEIRNKFLAVARESGNENAIALANATLPVNLAVNEGYVAFNYDKDGFEAADGNTIPVYVGELKNFDFEAYTAGYDYVAHRDDGSAENLYWAYNNGGYILSDTGVADNVTSSTVAVLKFEKVYRIRVDGGNDTKYDLREIQPELCYDNVGGSNEYKYLTESMAGDFLSGLTPRNGFTYRWRSGNKYITDLSEALEDVMTLSVQWRLNSPTVTAKLIKADGIEEVENNTITYGDAVSLTADVTHDIDGIKVTYSWTFEDETQTRWSTQGVCLANPRPSDYSGTYKLIVTVGGDEITSLGAVAQTSVNLKINRKDVTFDWHLPENENTVVYDGAVKTVSVSLPDGQQVEGDALDYVLSGATGVKDAGVYNFSIVTDAITGQNYNVTNPRNSVTITPRPIEVDWANYQGLVYDGSVKRPTATAWGVGSDTALTVNVTGGGQNAGVHTARASVAGGNYTVTNSPFTFNVAKKTLTATVGDTSLVYGNDDETASFGNVKYSGFVAGEDEGSSLSGGKYYIDPSVRAAGAKVGDYESVVGYTDVVSQNYELQCVKGKLTITQRTAYIEWVGLGDTEYDGVARSVNAIISNKVEGDDVALIVTGGDATDAGRYTAQVTQITGEDAGNYRFYTPSSRGYGITHRKAYVDWHISGNRVYDGQSHEVTYTIRGLIESDENRIDYSPESYLNAGKYTFEVKYLSEADKAHVEKNYLLQGFGMGFTVQPAQGAAEFFVNGIPYDNYYTAVIVGDTLSWKGNSHIWGYTVSLNGQTVYSSSDENVGAVFVYTDEGSYEFTAAGYYVFEIVVGGYDDNTTRNTVTFVINNVADVGGRNDVV